VPLYQLLHLCVECGKDFLVGGDEFTKLSFEKGSHRIDFVFYENQLNTVILLDTENWSN
jgi:hypothetical protein